MQRQLTSVFSDYESMDNNSANSKQLEYWLKQIANPVQPANTGFEWTLMSNRSSQFQQINPRPNHTGEHTIDELSFGRTVHSSVERGKQNNSQISNTNQSMVVQNKSKSYVNAMLALQKKVKTLEDENVFMRKSLAKIHDDKNKSMSESLATEEQLKAKIQIMQPRLARLDSLIQQNKVLRQSKQQKIRKIKMLQKNNTQLILKCESQQVRCQQLTKQCNQIKSQAQKLKNKAIQAECQVKKLSEVAKSMEDMKDKSTAALLEKYSKSIQHMEKLEKQNVKVKNQIHHLKNKQAQEIKAITQNYEKQLKKVQIQNQKIKENLHIKQGLIEEKRKEAIYFREAYEKKDEDFRQLIRNQGKIINLEKEKINQIVRENQQLKSTKDNPILNHKQNVSKEGSIVQIPQTLIHLNSSKQRKSFIGFQSEEDSDQFDESAIPVPAQTKSVGKPLKLKKKVDQKSVLSSESRKKRVVKNTNGVTKISNLASPKQNSKEGRKKRKQKQEASFTMRSCEHPVNRPVHRITFQGEFENQKNEGAVINSYYYTNQYPPLPHSPFQQVHLPVEDLHDQGRSVQSQSIDEAMLVELQKQLLQLYDEQEKLVLASNDDYASQSDRLEFVGRLKQINEQLRLKNQKICELKSKI